VRDERRHAVFRQFANTLEKPTTKTSIEEPDSTRRRFVNVVEPSTTTTGGARVPDEVKPSRCDAFVTENTLQFIDEFYAVEIGPVLP
jgi:hypothetical protein